MAASRRERLQRIDNHIARGRAHLRRAKAMRAPIRRKLEQARVEIERLKRSEDG